jgi:hypothetical protein
MNFHPSIRSKFFADADTNIACADARWSKMWGSLSNGPFNTDCMAETWKQQPCDKDPQVLPGLTPGPAPGPGPGPAPSPAPPVPEACASAFNATCGATVHDPEPACRNCWDAHKTELEKVGCTGTDAHELCGNSPAPGPAPGPVPAACSAIISQLCGSTGSEQACVDCAKAHEPQVKPDCPTMADVETACKTALVLFSV